MKKFLISTICLLACISFLGANDFHYQSPGGIIEEIFNRPYNPTVATYDNIGLKIYKDWFLYIPLDLLAEPITQLAGIKIYEKNRASVRSSFYTSFKWGELYSDTLYSLPVPQNSIFGADDASYDSKKTFFMEYKKEQINLWLIHLDSLKAGNTDNALEMLLQGGISQVFSPSVDWMPDNRHLLVRMIADDLTEPEKPSNVPLGPIILDSSGKESHNRTYPNLLKDEYDDDLFEYYATTQLVLLDTQAKTLTKILDPMMISYYSISPDGNYLLCREIIKPFSHKSPYSAFNFQWIIIDLANMTKEVLYTAPSRDNLKTGWVMQGIRSFWWDQSKDHSLFCLKTLDDGSPDSKKKYKDEVLTINLPNLKSEKSLYRSQNRIANFEYINNHIIHIAQYNWKEKKSNAFLKNLNTKKEFVIYDKLNDEQYDLPGKLQYKVSEDGRTRPQIIDNCIFLIGTGLTKDNRKPFIDKVNIDTFITERIIEFDEEDYITINYILDQNPDEFFLRRQNKNTPNNLYTYNIKTKEERAISKFTDNTPELTNLQKEVIQYTRADSVLLSGILYLPADYDGSKPLPLIMSAYPREYSDSETASQSTHTDKQYVRPWSSSPLYFCLNGFAVLQDASFPIIGDPETVNDTWMEQAVANAKAAIDYLADKGIVDSNKVIIQGHSYGAFLVVNLLAHCDLFAGGIARNGAYNRTLTPFGFQKERRTLWQAKDVYLNLSPFLFVDKIQKPLLLIHSIEDTNPGTFPLQSQRLYEALEGNGKDCRYIQLPLEDHTYYAKETHLHLLWEYQKFFDKVLNTTPSD